MLSSFITAVSLLLLASSMQHGRTQYDAIPPVFWKRVESSGQLQQKVGRVSREIPSQEWVTVYEERMPQASAADAPGRLSADAAGQAAGLAGSDS